MSSYLDQIIKLQKRGTYPQQKGYLSPFYTLHLGPYGSENVLLLLMIHLKKVSFRYNTSMYLFQKHRYILTFQISTNINKSSKKRCPYRSENVLLQVGKCPFIGLAYLKNLSYYAEKCDLYPIQNKQKTPYFNIYGVFDMF